MRAWSARARISLWKLHVAIVHWFGSWWWAVRNVEEGRGRTLNDFWEEVGWQKAKGRH
jgi:hypothetical protein